MKPILETLSGIETLSIRKPQQDVAVVFLHGYGANMNDLFPLWELWDMPNFDWFFPNGLLPLPMGYYEGRAWFPIDMAALDRAIREGRHRDMAESVPVGFDEIISQLATFLGELKTRYKKIVLGGFSQGAMCSAHLATHPGVSLDGLILLSGNLVAQSKFPKAAKSVPFYQSHGMRDPILSLEGAKALEATMQQLNFQGKLHPFPGAHEIPMSVVNDVKNFLLEFKNA